MRQTGLWAQLALAGMLGGQSLSECRSVYLRPMPESLDEFIAVELLKSGLMKVVTAEAKADCVAAFGRRGMRAELKTTGGATAPAEASLEADAVRDELPSSTFLIATRKIAALTLVHRATSTVVWADSKADAWFFTAGPRTLARKLVEQLRKDLAARPD